MESIEETIDLETLLNKLVTKKTDGVTYKEIAEYKKRVLDACSKNGIRTVFYGLSKDQLTEVVRDYPNQFRVFNNTYYPGIESNNNCFERRNSQKVKKILDEKL